MLPEQLIILQPMVDYIMEKQIELNFQQFKDYIKCILDVRIYLEFKCNRKTSNHRKQPSQPISFSFRVTSYF